jgi:hypothetical protein
MTRYRRVTMHHKGGLIRVLVDGELLMQTCIFREDRPAGGLYGGDPLYSLTQFGELGDAGQSSWKSVQYEVHNRAIEDWAWEWRAEGRQWPDQYQRDRLIQIHANELTEDHRPDHGYSSWLVLPDGRIILVDYTNLGDPMGKSHLVGVYLAPEDIA